MSIKSAHYTTISTLFRGLKDANKDLSPLPSEASHFRWNYLSADNYNILGLTEWTNDGKSPIISIHPLAFTPSWEFVLLGLLNHELSHLVAGSDAAHGPIFVSIEQRWDGYEAWTGERREFASFVQNEVKANLENLRHLYRCQTCSRIVQCKHRLSPGAACFVCCALNNSGRWLKSAVLIYNGLQPTNAPEGNYNEPRKSETESN